MTELDEHHVTPTRIEIERLVPFAASDIFEVLTDPEGHVDIDSTGMLQTASGTRVSGVGDEFVVHMDRESLGDYDLGRYDVTVRITEFEPDRQIAWTIEGQIKPPIGHVYGYRLEPVEEGATRVVSYYDWSDIHDDWKRADIFPVISALAVKATLGILERVTRRRTERS